MPYTEQFPHAGSAEVLFTGMFDEPAGTLARTVPRGQLTSATLSSPTTTGTVCVRAIALPAGLVVTNIMVLIGNTAAVGPAHFWLGLCDAQLNVLAVSADATGNAQAATTAIKLAMGTPYQVPQTGLYYVALSSSASTTAPTLTGGTAVAGTVAPLSPPVLCGTAGAQATPPAAGSQINSGSITAAQQANYAAWIS